MGPQLAPRPCTPNQRSAVPRKAPKAIPRGWDLILVQAAQPDMCHRKLSEVQRRSQGCFQEEEALSEGEQNMEVGGEG